MIKKLWRQFLDWYRFRKKLRERKRSDPFIYD